MKFITLHTTNGIEVVFNADYLIGIYPHDEGSVLTCDASALGSGNNTSVVREKPHEIMRLINGESPK